MYPLNGVGDLNGSKECQHLLANSMVMADNTYIALLLNKLLTTTIKMSRQFQIGRSR